MTHFTLTTVFIALFFFTVNGQSQELPKEGPAFYFNSFQKYRNTNIDSSLYFARLLAVNPDDSTTLEDLLHNSFAQSFLTPSEELINAMKNMDSLQKKEYQKMLTISPIILDRMMSDSNINLVNTVKPINFWVKVHQNENNINELTKLTNEFIKTELSINDIYKNRVGRYALLIYQVISQKPELNNLSEKLFTTTIEKLKLNQVNSDSLSRPGIVRRAWYKYLYAYSNFIIANQLVKLDKDKEAVYYYKIASEYSPNLSDKSVSYAYFYDMYFLLGKEKTTFQDDYLDILIKTSKDKNEALSTLLAMTLVNAENSDYKRKLHSFYDSNFSKQETFSNFWIKTINKNLKPVIDFSLKQMDGNIFSTADNKGKWTLIDFWGTWCGPCRMEHPDLQKFYQSTKTKDTSNFVILTVACRNNESDVTSYMKEFKYNFPVALADQKIEGLYNINSYPSKILITPQGNYLVIPFGLNWVDFIKNYADL
jgi:thiol-disulfide isomerase/thioredoxin